MLYVFGDLTLMHFVGSVMRVDKSGFDEIGALSFGRWVP